jgi:hypothetical protein
MVIAERTRWIVVAVAVSLVAALGAGVAATSGILAADEPTQTAVRLDPPERAVVIGDSAISALRWVPQADSAIVGFEHTLDLESCRRLYDRSCFGREGRLPPTVYEALDLHGSKYYTLVVATGYNDGTPHFQLSFEQVVARARQLGYTRILWWTLRSDVDYVAPGAVANHATFATNNQIVRDRLATGDYPDVVLADWGGYTAGKHEWFVTDGVHYRAVGAWAASDYLTRKMAFLEERPCPVPVAPNQAPQDPCPDPDITGPVADVEALYPIGADGVLCYEIGPERRIECHNDTHVIKLTRELARDMVGDDVRSLQTRLFRFDLFDSYATGTFGSPTQAGVEAFQAAHGLGVTGVADVATLQALGFDTSGIVVSPP